MSSRNKKMENINEERKTQRTEERKITKTNKNMTLQPGSKLGKYRIGKFIGRGRFSYVFSARDESKNCKNDNLAIKIDINPKENETNLLQMEYNIMRSFGNNNPYICNAHDFGKLPNDTHEELGHYLCMELCEDKNLSGRRKAQNAQCFGLQKGALIGIEMLYALQSFHRDIKPSNLGYVHRDIKPSNFVIPLKTYWENHIYILDFGLSTKWHKHLHQTQKKTDLFVGTSLYASLNAHNKLDLSPIDDLWSLIFVIIDISTNLLPWKRMYITLENQSKLRRTQIAQMKKQFIQYMTGNNCNLFLGKYKFVPEYKEFMRCLNGTQFNEMPKYATLVHILQKIALNERYAREQYSVDHCCKIVSDNIPLHSNFELLGQELNLCFCDDRNGECARLHPAQLRKENSVHLCEAYTLNGYCEHGFKGESQWCTHGYHWNLNQLMHFRNTNELPTVKSVQFSVPSSSVQSPIDKSNTFSSQKCEHFWSALDRKELNACGLWPRGIDFEREMIKLDNFELCLNESVRGEYNALIANGIFQQSDFANSAVINALYRLNVSQTIDCFQDLRRGTPQRADQSYLLNALHNARRETESPTHNYHILYPALYQRTLDNSKFKFEINECHSENESESAKMAILIRLEEFVRRARDKVIGDKVIDLLMNTPCKYAIQVLDELQMMGLHRVASLTNAIKRACDQKIESAKSRISRTRTHSHTNNNNNNKSHSGVKVVSAVVSKPSSENINILSGELGYLDTIISDMKSVPKPQPQPQPMFITAKQKKGVNHFAPYLDRKATHKPMLTSSFKMLIPKKTHLIKQINHSNVSNTNQNHSRAIIKKKKQKQKHTHKQKQKRKQTQKGKKKRKKKERFLLKKKEKPKKRKKEIESEDEYESLIVRRNHSKRKRAINDSSDDDIAMEVGSDDSEDDIPINRKRKRNYSDNESHKAKKRKTNTTNTNPLQQILSPNNIAKIVQSLEYSFSALTQSQCNEMYVANQSRTRKEIERDSACELVSKHMQLTPQNNPILQMAPLNCFKCGIDPKDMEWELLLCEYCPTGAAHCSCIDPPYHSVPEGRWACPECQQKTTLKFPNEYHRLCQSKLEKYHTKWRTNERSLQTRISQTHIQIQNNNNSVIINQINPIIAPIIAPMISQMAPLPIPSLFQPQPIPIPPSVNLRNIPNMNSARINNANTQGFDQFLHYLNSNVSNVPNGNPPRTQHIPSPTNININKLNVTTYNCYK